MNEVTVNENDALLQSVVDGIKYVFTKDVLVKPMPITMVMKEITSQVLTGEVDEDGIEKYDTTVEEKKMESIYRTGIVLSLPKVGANDDTVKIGDKVVYAKRNAIDFDLFKDSQLVKLYDIIATIKD
jgi:hypothetical protein